jgi:hypothetical protein
MDQQTQGSKREIVTARQQRKRRSDGPLAALLGPAEAALQSVLVARSVAEDPRCWSGGQARVVEDAALGRAVRELGDRVELVAARSVDASLLRALGDRLPALLVLAGEPAPELLAELTQLSRRQATSILGPGAALWIGAPELEDGAATPIACAAHRDELAQLCQAIGPTRLAIAPTPSWLPRWLTGPMLLAHDVVGYVPSASLELGWLDWIDWLASLGARELRQLLVPLGVPRVELEPHAPMLEAATVAHALERLSGPTYPAPQVLALLREGVRCQLELQRGPQLGTDREGHAGHDHDAAARALWDQARRALPRIGELVGMQEPDPSLSLRVPTAAFLAQRGLLRFRASQALLASAFEPPELPEPELLARADAVLEGASEVLSGTASRSRARRSPTRPAARRPSPTRLATPWCSRP